MNRADRISDGTRDSSEHKTRKKIGSAIGWIITLVCVLRLAVSFVSFLQSRKTGEPVTVAGYRPVYVLTGSMEPFMKEDSIVITKSVDTMDDIGLNDVVTYHILDEEGKELVITHRIKEIGEDGSIITKGDNNRVKDVLPITIDNIEARVVLTCNWVASFVHLWGTIRGKILIGSMIAAVFFLMLSFRLFRPSGENERYAGTAPK